MRTAYIKSNFREEPNKQSTTQLNYIKGNAHHDLTPETGLGENYSPFSVIHIRIADTLIGLFPRLSFSCVSIALTISDSVAPKRFCRPASADVARIWIQFPLARKTFAVQ
jgi:hypothetical protein